MDYIFFNGTKENKKPALYIALLYAISTIIFCIVGLIYNDSNIMQMQIDISKLYYICTIIYHVFKLKSIVYENNEKERLNIWKHKISNLINCLLISWIVFMGKFYMESEYYLKSMNVLFLILTIPNILLHFTKLLYEVDNTNDINMIIVVTIVYVIFRIIMLSFFFFKYINHFENPLILTIIVVFIRSIYYSHNLVKRCIKIVYNIAKITIKRMIKIFM